MLRDVQAQEGEQRGIVCGEGRAGSGGPVPLCLKRGVLRPDCGTLCEALCVQLRHVLGCSANGLGDAGCSLTLTNKVSKLKS